MENNVLVILASYNGDKFIKEQILSILSQNSVSVQLYIFDDCSEDSTVDIVNSINDERIHLFKNKIPSGNAANNFLNSLSFILNSKFCDYEYISFSDQDDLWLNDKLFNAINSLYTKKFDLYCSNLEVWDEKNNDIKKIIKKDFVQKKYDFLFEGGSAGCTYVFTRNFAEKLIENFSKLNLENWKYFSHDWYIYFFARINKYNVFIDNNSFILYRIHQSNVHGQLNLNNFNAFKKRIQLIKSGWYFNQTNNFKQLISDNEEFYNIYEMYNRNIFSRVYILLKYNFKLMRSNKKFIKFFILSIFLKINKL